MGREHHKFVWKCLRKVPSTGYAQRRYDTYLLPCRCIHLTVDVCPYSVCMHWPVSAFHTLSVRSVEPLIMMLLDIWDDHTPPVWPTRVRRHCVGIKRDHCFIYFPESVWVGYLNYLKKRYAPWQKALPIITSSWITDLFVIKRNRLNEFINCFNSFKFNWHFLNQNKPRRTSLAARNLSGK